MSRAHCHLWLWKRFGRATSFAWNRSFWAFLSLVAEILVIYLTYIYPRQLYKANVFNEKAFFMMQYHRSNE